MTLIEEMLKLNTEIVTTSIEYSVRKLNLKKKEADILLNTNFEEALCKKRPTVDDKKAYVLLQTEELRHKVDESYINLEGLKRLYEIKRIEARVTGNFLNELAGVVKNE